MPGLGHVSVSKVLTLQAQGIEIKPPKPRKRKEVRLGGTFL